MDTRLEIDGSSGGAEPRPEISRYAPRVETVRFAAPLTPGRYRVGVDYSHACTESIATTVPFAIQVDGPAGREASRGLARYQVFEPIVLEFAIDRAAVTGAGGETDP